MERIGEMPVLFLFAFRFVRLLLSGHQAVCHRERSATNADSSLSTKTEASAADDRGSVVLGLSPQGVVRLATSFLLYVQADTVVRWRRERFRKFWATLSKSQRRRRGRPGTAAELRRLIEQMA